MGTTSQDFLRVIFRNKLLIIISTIIIVAAVFLRMQFIIPNYTASVKLIKLGTEEIDAVFYTAKRGGMTGYEAYPELVTTRTVLERVVEVLRLDQRPIDEEMRYASRLNAIFLERNINNLKLELEKMNPDERKAYLFELAVSRLKENVNTIVSNDKTVFEIQVTDSNPTAAVYIANAVSRSFIIYYFEQQAAEIQLKLGEKHAKVMQLKHIIEMLRENLSGKRLPDIEAMGPASIKIVEQAQNAVRSQSIQAGLNLGIAFISSIIFGILLAFIVDYLDQTFKSPKEVEQFLNIPVLYSIPRRKSNDKLILGKPNSNATKYTESLLNLTHQISLLMKDRNFKSLLITDAEGSKETPAIIVNLGIYLTQEMGHRVLIIDTNLRSHSISNVLNIANSPGLVDVLEGKINHEDAIQSVNSNLYILPSGETIFNPNTLLNSQRMSELLENANKFYDIVLVNCADIRDFTDAAILSSLTDATALVINERSVRRQVIENAIVSLKQKKIAIVGVIFNNRTYAIPEILYRLT
jgi:capsular exopolysaccharide synthesis family protein